jgi:hypothetical protein
MHVSHCLVWDTAIVDQYRTSHHTTSHYTDISVVYLHETVCAFWPVPRTWSRVMSPAAGAGAGAAPPYTDVVPTDAGATNPRPSRKSSSGALSTDGSW